MDHLLTEARNPASANLDDLTPLELVQLMATEDALVPAAVAAQAESIARGIEVIAEALRQGGRLIYAGAGTSGRLGVLDATECPPTFNSPPGQVVGIIAGGPRALTQAVEGAEDHPEFAETDLQELELHAGDVVVGIATSGRTPYALGAVAYARRLGCRTIGVACNPASELSGQVDIAITVTVGPEVLSGSTRLKAGTATKLVLNMLSTGAMVCLGKTFGNLMVDLRATNEKLRARTNRIVRLLTGLSREEADGLLQRCSGELKTALVAKLGQISPEAARERLHEADGQVRQALSVQPKAPAATHGDLLLGIDGGGTSTVALLAKLGEAGDKTILGRGEAGPSNMHAVGPGRAFTALDQAVEAAFNAAGIARCPAAAACLGLAGADRPAEREQITAWAHKVRLAATINVANDATLLLTAGTPAGWGLAVIAGTGSIAYVQDDQGRTGRAGGWGYLLGDEGSAYAVAMAGLHAVVRAADGRGPSTALSERLLTRLGLRQPPDLIAAIYRGNLDRAALASLAPTVFESAEAGDAIAGQIVAQAAQALAETAAAAVRRLFRPEQSVPTALAGGVLIAHDGYRRRFLDALRGLGVRAEPVSVVTEPARGALRCAAKALRPAVSSAGS